MKLIVGLGNPGHEFDKTRHNLGFEVIDNLSKKFNSGKFEKESNGLVSKTNINGEEILLVKPLTYMNDSGVCVKELMDFYKLDPIKDIVIIYDDLSIDLGKFKIKKKGRAAGHNGIKSIISNIGSSFIRFKCGIDTDTEKEQIIDFVLNRFDESELKEVTKIIETASKGIELIIKGEQIDKVIEKLKGV